MRLIDADALIKDNGLECATKYGNKCAKQRTKSYSTMMLYEIAEMIDEAPTIDAEPVKYGHWIAGFGDEWHCSVCHNYTYSQRPPYCEYCGAKNK